MAAKGNLSGVLGGPFLRSVVAVFDVGKEKCGLPRGKMK
jgi:hypothetical protein